MKKYIAIMAVAIAVCNVAAAQNKLGAKVDVEQFGYCQDSVKVNLTFDLDDLKIGANQSVVFSPNIFKGDNTIKLPSVVVQSRGGARLYRRSEVLDNAKSMSSYQEWFGSPYQKVAHYGAQKEDVVHYSQSIPYQSWMVNSELYVDCSTCGCCSTEDEGILVPDDNTLLIDIPSIGEYVVVPQVELVKPAKVAIKRRDIQYSSALIFKVNSTYIDPNLEGNRAELASIDNMMQSVISDDDYTITKVNIIGYASPEGKLASNMKLSEGRAAALETLMKQKYTMIAPELYSVRFGGENWPKLREIVAQGDLADKEAILHIIDTYSIEDGRESRLMALKGGAPYRYLLKNIFPSTRLVLVDVEYNIDAYDIVRIGELIDTKPQNLSLDEMYRLSETYTVEDNEFEKIFMTAAQVYPDDEVAQNNALVTEIRGGNLDAVAHIAERVDRNTQSAELANSLGVYYMLTGDYEQSEDMLERAVSLGCVRAEGNMVQLTKKLENMRQIAENEAFRAKIYGGD